jgi:exonuclease VII small subunit
VLFAKMQLEAYFIGSIFLLIALIIALIVIIILRDGRELKTKQIAADLSQLEEVVEDLKKIKGELVSALSSFKKHDAALSQIEGHLKQISSAVANLDHRQQPAGTIREKQDDRRDRDRGQKQSGRGKTWGSGYKDDRPKEYSGASDGVGVAVTINDGEKYAKVSELAANGLTAQEIAKKLNVGMDEVSLVLNLKGKRPVV